MNTKNVSAQTIFEKSWKNFAVLAMFAISMLYFLVALVGAAKEISQKHSSESISNRPQPVFPLRALPSVDSKYRAYELTGGESWGLAYDQVSGHMAVTSDKAGVMVYDIDDVLQGKLRPVVILNKGIPSGLCSKVWQSQRLFLAIQADRNEIVVFDAETLKQVDSIQPTGPIGFSRIASSVDPDDPYVYCLSVSDPANEKWGNRVVRVDLSTKTSLVSDEKFRNVTTSYDGLTLLCQPIAIEKQFRQQHFRPIESAETGKLEMEFLFEQKPGSYSFSPVDLGPNAGYASNFSFVKEFPHYPRACFRNLPLMVGWHVHGGSSMGVFSTDRYEMLDSFEGQVGWKQVEKESLFGRIPTDTPRNASCESWLTDDQRKLFAFLISDRLVICELDQVNIRSQINKGSVGRFPSVVDVGEKIKIRFDDLTPGTTVTAADANGWLSLPQEVKNRAHAMDVDGGGLNGGLPVVIDNEFRWIPAARQTGPKNIVLSARLNGSTVQWEWKVLVNLPPVMLPFRPAGMECGEDSLAIVWGESWPKPAVKSRHIVATLNLETMQIVDQFEVSHKVFSATLDSKNLYVCCQADADKEQVGSPQPATLTSYEIMSKSQTATIDAIRFDEMITLGNRFLLARGTTGDYHRYVLPSLLELPPQDGDDPFAGRLCGDFAIWDGMLRDRKTWTNQLLCRPIHMPLQVDTKKKIKLPDGSVGYAEFGPSMFEWFPKGDTASKGRVLPKGPASATVKAVPLAKDVAVDESKLVQHCLTHYPGTVSLENGTLHLSDYLQRDMNERQQRRYLFEPRLGKVEGQLSSTKSNLYVVSEGMVYSLPVPSLFHGNELFSFVEKQNLFVLDFGSTNRIQYSAPRAIHYRLDLYAADESFTKPIFQMESKSGEFDLKLSDKSLFRKLAIHASGDVAGQSYDSPDLDAIRNYVNKVNPAIMELSGKRPAGIAVPVKAVVVAEHKDRGQRAGMVHYFYVDVPGKLIVNP